MISVGCQGDLAPRNVREWKLGDFQVDDAFAVRDLLKDVARGLPQRVNEFVVMVEAELSDAVFVHGEGVGEVTNLDSLRGNVARRSRIVGGCHSKWSFERSSV